MSNALSETLWYVFILSLVLVLVAYYVGFKTDVQSLSSAISSLFNMATGRNAQGVFAGYPTNSATPTTALSTSTGAVL